MKILSDFFKSISSDSTVNIDNDTLESFTDEKILAISILLIEVSKSDDYYDELEKNTIIEIIREKFSLDKNQIDLLINLADKKNDEMISLHDFIEVLNKECSYSEKKDLIKMLWDVAYIDGRIDKYEDYTIRKISDLLYITHSDFIQAKLR
ncbi:MAG: TerB family tellurite resistance protein [Gammaproteobacteria bacterium]|nr:TerB family tellurite resistance protein [Gammaproteobacteria bacterium]MBT5116528.1 TerB family tellurite resistance protein [Gammaproteobacteria bacterium]